MAELPQYGEFEKARLMLGLLESVDRDGEQSQRRLASELGVALGLVNAYLRRCVKKGLVKVREAPARRYAYYLTPRGFAEKSRLTVQYLSYSFSFLRRARLAYDENLRMAQARGFRRVVLAGASELAEIAIVCAISCGMEIVAIVDNKFSHDRYLGHKVAPSFKEVGGEFDCVIITNLNDAREIFLSAVHEVGAERVLAPDLLGLTKRNGRAGGGAS